MTSVPPTGERAPQQDRSRQSWERVLAAGMELFEAHGWSGLTITDVCRIANVSAPSIYARVDGKAGLFRAVHERWLAQFAQTENELIAQHVKPGRTTTDAASAVARVLIGIFARHSPALRALISRSIDDPDLLERGSDASRGLLARLAATIPADPTIAMATARAVYAECLMRTMYGPSFLQHAPESAADFERRLTSLAVTTATSTITVLE